MTEENKTAALSAEETEEETQAAAEQPLEDPDADIDSYIRELTGIEAPKKKKEDAPEVEEFRVTSQIGEDDYKAFIRYTTLFRAKWMLPALIILPLVLSIAFAFADGIFYWMNAVLSIVLMYAALFGVIQFRNYRWISKIRKNSPQVMYLTDTTLIFLTYHVVNLKNGVRQKVSYKHMIDACESRDRFIMYFDNGKSMLFRKEDMDPEVLEKFRPFIRSKVHSMRMFGKK